MAEQDAANDIEFEDYELTKVLCQDDADGRYANVQWGSTGFGFRLQPGQEDPKVGDMLRVYGAGMGSIIRGAARVEDTDELSRYVYFHRTPEEQARKNTLDKQERHAQQVKEFRAKEPEYRERIAKLPEEFRLRFADFESHGGEAWLAQNLGYELFIAEEALTLVAFIQGGSMTIQEFHARSYEEQVALNTGMRLDQHSGNTFGAACSQANTYLQKPEARK